MEIHSGHRERMKKRFLETGLNGFDDVNVLELLLFYAIPRQDTNPVAHALLERFGSVHGVFEATVDDLKTVKGVGENAAILLHLIPQVCKRYMFSKKKRNEIITSLDDLYRYILPLFAFDAEEFLYMLCLDSGNRVLDCSQISQGAVDTVNVNSRKILEVAVARHASKIVLAHNHPSGILTPSYADIEISKRLESALKVFEIELMDHVIVGDGECISMRREGCF